MTGQPQLDELKAMLSGGRIGDLLTRIAAIVDKQVHDPKAWGQGVFVPQLDALVHQAGSAIFTGKGAAPPEPQENRRNIFIATQLYADGGHTRLIEEMVELLGGHENEIVITDLFGAYAQGRSHDVPLAKLRKLGARISILPARPLPEKVGALMDLLCERRPENVFLMAHYQDVVAIASTCPALGLRCYFLHHTEHSVALGSSLKGYVHVDFRPASWKHCSQHLGRPTIHLPLSSGAQSLKTFSAVSLKSCSTVSGGNWFKYVCTPSPVNYVDALVRILGHTGGSHFHFSQVPEKAQQTIRAALSRNGIDPGRFKYLGWVPSVGETLHRIDAHIYLPSFPWGGGLSNVEAMGNGYPVIRPLLKGTPPMLQIDMDYPESEPWSTLDELIEALDRTIAGHQEHSQLARKHYETFHTRDRFKQRLLRMIS